jgi:homocitrate synthase NifV
LHSNLHLSFLKEQQMQNNHRIIDTTLREGEQTPGVTFTLSEKMRIVDGLAAIGVAEVEVGIASPLVRDIDKLLAYCRDRHPRLPLSLWSRCHRDDITLAGRLGPDVLSLSIPVSDLHLGPRLGKDRHWARRQMSESIAMAVDAGLSVSVGFEDATRADTGFLAEMAGRAELAGAGRIRLADTVGLCSPGRISGLIATMLAAVVDCDLAVHTHNDFGMATANAVAALEAGAVWADATVLGLGERAGCARLEELVGYLRLEKGQTGLAPEHLKGLAEYVAARSACTIDPARPLIGDRIFTCETGLHLQGLQKDPATYEPYPPEQVGAERRLLFGAKCGRRAVIERLRRLGHCPDEGQINRRIATFRDRALSAKTTLTDTELLAALG